jgi:hypothetical protein
LNREPMLNLSHKVAYTPVWQDCNLMHRLAAPLPYKLLVVINQSGS